MRCKPLRVRMVPLWICSVSGVPGGKRESSRSEIKENGLRSAFRTDKPFSDVSNAFRYGFIVRRPDYYFPIPCRQYDTVVKRFSQVVIPLVYRFESRRIRVARNCARLPYTPGIAQMVFETSRNHVAYKSYAIIRGQKKKPVKLIRRTVRRPVFIVSYEPAESFVEKRIFQKRKKSRASYAVWSVCRRTRPWYRSRVPRTSRGFFRESNLGRGGELNENFDYSQPYDVGSASHFSAPDIRITGSFRDETIGMIKISFIYPFFEIIMEIKFGNKRFTLEIRSYTKRS